MNRLDRCPRCQGREFRDVPIHNGRSVRRDCATARCRATWGFPVWYGQVLTKHWSADRAAAPIAAKHGHLTAEGRAGETR